jgi:hypothetical protein
VPEHLCTSFSANSLQIQNGMNLLWSGKNLGMNMTRAAENLKMSRMWIIWMDCKGNMVVMIVLILRHRRVDSDWFGVSAGISKGQAQNQNSVLITQEDAKSTSPAGDGAISTESTVTITVVGASGDLAKKKIFPALFALYYEGCLPKVHTLSLSFLNWIWDFELQFCLCCYKWSTSFRPSFLTDFLCQWQHFTVFGYARSKMTDEELRNMISATLTCRIDQR